jgi:hypothetical protein
MFLRPQIVLYLLLFLLGITPQQVTADPIQMIKGRVMLNSGGVTGELMEFSTITLADPSNSIFYTASRPDTDGTTLRVSRAPHPDVFESGRLVDLSSRFSFFETPGYLADAQLFPHPDAFQFFLFTGDFTFTTVPSILTVMPPSNFPTPLDFRTSSEFRAFGALTAADPVTREVLFQMQLLGRGTAFGFFDVNKEPLFFVDYHLDPVPEPATFLLFSLGAALTGRSAWQRRRIASRK